MKILTLAIANLVLISLFACTACTRRGPDDAATTDESAEFQFVVAESKLKLNGIGSAAYLEGADGTVQSIRLSLLSGDQKAAEAFTEAHVGDTLTLLLGDPVLGSARLRSSVSSSITFDGLDGRFARDVEQRIRQASGKGLEVWPFQASFVSGGSIDEMAKQITGGSGSEQGEGGDDERP